MLDKPVPIFRQLADIDPTLNLSDLAVFGVVYLYSQMSKGYCDASAQTIGEEILLNEKTIDRLIKKLLETGLIIDNTPENRRKAHQYAPSPITAKFTNWGQNVPSNNEGTGDKMSLDLDNWGQNVPSEPGELSKSGDKMSHNSNSSNNPAPEKIKQPEQTPFTIAYNRWITTFGDLETGQRSVFGDYFDDVDCKPEWVLKAVNETIAAAPKGAPFRYFKRIIDGYITTNGPVEREPAKPVVKTYGNGNGNGHKEPSTSTPQNGPVGQIINGIRIVGRS